jgi:hypothetical protein
MAFHYALHRRWKCDYQVTRCVNLRLKPRTDDASSEDEEMVPQHAIRFICYFGTNMLTRHKT